MVIINTHKLKLFSLLTALLIAFSFSSCNNEIDETASTSLSSHYSFLNGAEKNGLILKPEKVYNFNYSNVTLCEYLLDKATGIGAVKLSVSKEYYESNKESINLYISRDNLITESSADILCDDKNAFVYYSFAVKDSSNCELTFGINPNNAIKLNCTSTEFKKSTEDYDTLISHFGIRKPADKDVAGETTTYDSDRIESKTVANGVSLVIFNGYQTFPEAERFL